MSGFSYTRAEILARREGITFREACRRIGRAGARRRNAKARTTACAPQPNQQPPAAPYWWQEKE